MAISVLAVAVENEVMVGRLANGSVTKDGYKQHLGMMRSTGVVVRRWETNR